MEINKEYYGTLTPKQTLWTWAFAILIIVLSAFNHTILTISFFGVMAIAVIMTILGR